jgi:hypothetical protein
MSAPFLELDLGYSDEVCRIAVSQPTLVDGDCHGEILHGQAGGVEDRDLIDVTTAMWSLLMESHGLASLSRESFSASTQTVTRLLFCTTSITSSIRFAV